MTHLLDGEQTTLRLQALDQCAIIDTAAEPRFDTLAALASAICGTPIALIGFIDDRREWFKARVGLSRAELPIDQSLDAALLAHADPLVISDARADPRCANHPPLGDPAIRFYASTPIRAPDGCILGALAVAGPAPRDLPPPQLAALHALADQIDALIALRALRRSADERRQQAFLIELGRRALGDETLTELMAWMVREIARVLGVDRCRILELLPNDEAIPIASFGWDAAPLPNNAMPLNRYLLAAAAMQAGQPIVVEDDAHGRRAGGLARLLDDGIASGASLIIPGSPRPYGLLGVYNTRRRSITPAEIALLQTAADHLAEVIAQRWRLQDLDAIVRLSRILRRAATRSAMMTIILDHIHTVCQSEGAALILHDPEGRVYIAQGHGIWAGATGTPLPAGSGLSWQVMQTGQPFIGSAPDFPLAPTAPQAQASVCVALMFNKQPIGALWVAYATTASYYSRHLLVALADVVASAINRSDLHDQTIRLYQTHQQLTQEVRRAERHLSSIVESASDLVVSTDTAGRISTWNRAAERVSGFTRAQIIGRHLHDLCDPAHQALMDELITSLLASASFGQVEIPLIDAAHHDVPVSWRLAAIQSDMGEIVGIVAIGRDLAEQRRMESQLFQAAKMASMGVMASGIGHELRNPLSVISANAQLAQERIPNHTLVRTCLQQIHAATGRAALIIDNLLTFARPRHEGVRLVNVNEILAATFLLLDHQIRQGQTRLSAALSHPIPLVLGNDSLLQQVFTNLILNALQAMQGGGDLYVATAPSADRGVEVVVKDTGVGIPPEVLPHVFDPFFTTRPTGQGTGLGLAISYSIIQQHGGSIGAASTPGVGSAFSVRLPAAPGLEPHSALALRIDENHSPDVRCRLG